MKLNLSLYKARNGMEYGRFHLKLKNTKWKENKLAKKILFTTKSLS
jgi:hypothetical protein